MKKIKKSNNSSEISENKALSPCDGSIFTDVGQSFKLPSQRRCCIAVSLDRLHVQKKGDEINDIVGISNNFLSQSRIFFDEKLEFSLSENLISTPKKSSSVEKDEVDSEVKNKLMSEMNKLHV